jgi:hypothetical protein
MIKKFLEASATRKLSIITALVALIGQILKIWDLAYQAEIQATLSAAVAFLSVVLAGNAVNKIHNDEQ